MISNKQLKILQLLIGFNSDTQSFQEQIRVDI